MLALVPEPNHVRRDKRGRRIGRNWWREWNVDLLRCAHEAWLADRERVALGYETEMREYEQAHPQPTLKDFLIANAGMGGEQAA